TEEIYQEHFRSREKTKSVHTTTWPQPFAVDEEAEKTGDLLVEALAQIRKFKSDSKISLAKEIEKITIAAGEQEVRRLKNVEQDLRSSRRLDLKSRSGG
ncbi:MAG: class I tRNA ligase family protein, partial [Candidatus Altiarchaeota archaeon]|nr:class I tRNA ligase family protein [Candidatus Altiarchaeota archaeon]